MDDHTVRVNEGTLEKLKGYKNRWSLSYNDIIDMALDVLDATSLKDAKINSTREEIFKSALNGIDKVNMKEIAVEAPAYRIKVSLNRVRINDNVMNLLKSGYDLFIPDITHRQAMYVKRKLSNMGFEVEYNKGETDGKSGFLFSTIEKRSASPLPHHLAEPDPSPSTV